MLTFPVIFYALLGGCLLLGAGLLAAAWRRPNRQRRGLRLLASAAAPAALWLAAYPPLRSLPLTQAAGILLTAGYQPDSLQQLRRQLGAGTPVWSYGVPTPSGATPLSNLLALAERRPPLRQLHLLGQGVPAADLPALAQLPIQSHAAAPFSGFRAAQWSPHLLLGEPLVVAGAVALPAGTGAAWVSLHAAGAGHDSVRLPAHGGAFRLRYRPKVAGLLRPTLVLRQAGRVVATEPVPVEVTAAPLPAVLLLAAAPSFEFKFLKNALAAQGRAVALRTPISRGMVQAEVVNQPALPLEHLTPALLGRYPLVVADAAALAALPAAESQRLRAAVQAGRLGLVVRAEAGPLPAAVPAHADFGVLAQPTAGAPEPQPLTWPGGPAGARAALPARLRPGAALRPLATGPGAAVAVASRRVGQGTVVVATVAETFRWVLSGQPATHSSFWSRLLGAATPPPAPAMSWQLASHWPRPGYPLVLHLSAGELPAAELPTVRPLAGGLPAQVALTQDARLPEWRTAHYWPQVAGWHEVRGPGASSYRFFVYDSAAWQGPELAERRQALAQRAAVAQPGSNRNQGYRQEPWPASWFFALFLLAAGFLWLEEKL